MTAVQQHCHHTCSVRQQFQPIDIQAFAPVVKSSAQAAVTVEDVVVQHMVTHQLQV
jgi:hypothetical protein